MKPAPLNLFGIYLIVYAEILILIELLHLRTPKNFERSKLLYNFLGEVS